MFTLNYDKISGNIKGFQTEYATNKIPTKNKLCKLGPCYCPMQIYVGHFPEDGENANMWHFFEEKSRTLL